MKQVKKVWLRGHCVTSNPVSISLCCVTLDQLPSLSVIQ